MKKTFFLCLVALTCFTAASTAQQLFQSVENRFTHNISVGKRIVTAPDPASWIEMGDTGTTKGLLLPRTDTSKITKRAGMLIYNISDSSIYFCSGTAWRKL